VGNAIALDSSVFNLARLLGPAVGGFVINAVGAGGCYVVDGFSYLAVIVALLMMKISLPASRREQKHPFIEMRDGFHYAFNLKPIRAVIVTVAFISLVGFSYSVLTPMFAKNVFGGDARILGLLMSASGVGALLGATYLGTRSGIRGIGKIIALGILLMAAGLIGFAVATHLPFALVCLAVTGAGGVLMMASSNTVLQTLVEEEKRGRVMSIFTMAFTGTMPLGNLVIGSVAETIGAKIALIGSGAVCLLVGLLFYRQLPSIRQAAAHLLEKFEQAQNQA
jgi:predicted MFS family arabinose efflux permease